MWWKAHTVLYNRGCVKLAQHQLYASITMIVPPSTQPELCTDALRKCAV